MAEKTGERILDVRNLRKYFPIKKGFFRKTVAMSKRWTTLVCTSMRGNPRPGGRERMRQDDGRSLHSACYRTYIW